MLGLTMLPEHSLFSSLHVWARCQDENFCTEGLIYILRLMLREAPTEAVNLLSWLTVDFISLNTVPSSINISGQVVGQEGRPDIVIDAGMKKAIVEVKVDSPVGTDQLFRYRQMLARHSGEKRLILLSRGNDELSPENEPDYRKRWIDLAKELEMALNRLEAYPSKTTILLADYLTFLGTKQMKLNAVTNTTIHSLTEVATLKTQIKQAIKDAGFKTRAGVDENTMGYFLWDADQCLGWVGFNFQEPQWLFYTTEKSTNPVKIEGELPSECDLPGAAVMGKNWTNSIDLVDCNAYLEASAADQVAYLRKHLVEDSVRAFKAMLKQNKQE